MLPTIFVLIAVALAYVVSANLHLLSHIEKVVVTQKGVPHFTSDFGEPQWQSLPAGWGIGCFWSHMAVAVWALYPTPASVWPLLEARR